MAQKGGIKRHVDIPINNNNNNDDNGTSVIKLVKATTPKGLREVKNVLRWYVLLLYY